MKTFGFLLRLLGATASVIPLRLLRGRRRPTWTLREELLWTALRTTIHASDRHGFAWTRGLERVLRRPSPLLELVRMTDDEVAGVPCLHCVPKNGAEPEGTVVYFHGGGYALGSARSSSEIVARLALDVPARVLAIEYRLAPEHRFPAAHEDGLAVYRALLERGVRPEKLALSGDSAGGTLALGTMLVARDLGLPLPSAALLFSPWVDPEADSGSMVADDDVIDLHFLGRCLSAYLDGDESVAVADPRLSPLRAELRGLPPLFVQVGDAEVLLDQNRDFAARAQAAGVEVILKVYEDLFHTFQNFTALLPRADAAIADGTAFLRGRIGG